MGAQITEGWKVGDPCEAISPYGFGMGQWLRGRVAMVAAESPAVEVKFEGYAGLFARFPGEIRLLSPANQD
jgi:hypothetical protein